MSDDLRIDPRSEFSKDLEDRFVRAIKAGEIRLDVDYPIKPDPIAKETSVDITVVERQRRRRPFLAAAAVLVIAGSVVAWSASRDQSPKSTAATATSTPDSANAPLNFTISWTSESHDESCLTGTNCLAVSTGTASVSGDITATARFVESNNNGQVSQFTDTVLIEGNVPGCGQGSFMIAATYELDASTMRESGTWQIVPGSGRFSRPISTAGTSTGSSNTRNALVGHANSPTTFTGTLSCTA